MSSELINRISIKKDGVYISTHSSNDTAPYTSAKMDFLTKVYNENGQRGLDKEIIDMCFSYYQLRGSHKSVIPYSNAINEAINNKNFINIRKEYEELDSKAFSIANRFDEYKNLTEDESKKMYSELKPKLKKLRDERNEFVADLVERERRKIIGPKEIAEGIYEIIPVHNVEEGVGEIYSEYMNFNCKMGTIIYEKRLGNLLQSPEIMRISEYQELIDKRGVENISGAKEFIKFIKKYPDIYEEGIKNTFPDFGSNTYKGIYYSVMDDCDENKGGYYVELYKVIDENTQDIDFDNRLDYFVIHIDNEYEMHHPDEIVKEYIDTYLIELKNENNEENSR